MSSFALTSVSMLEYRDSSVLTQTREAVEQSYAPAIAKSEAVETSLRYTAEEMTALVEVAREEAVRTTEERVRQEASKALAVQDSRLTETIKHFDTERRLYFERIESEAVQLVLSIARKILQRESQADPMLLLGLVRVALNQMQDGPPVTLRVTPSEVAKWREFIGSAIPRCGCEVIGDPDLSDGDCFLDTHLGSANFNVGLQMKAVEQGFYDLLSHRPGQQ